MDEATQKRQEINKMFFDMVMNDAAVNIDSLEDDVIALRWTFGDNIIMPTAYLAFSSIIVMGVYTWITEVFLGGLGSYFVPLITITFALFGICLPMTAWDNMAYKFNRKKLNTFLNDRGFLSIFSPSHLNTSALGSTVVMCHPLSQRRFVSVISYRQRGKYTVTLNSGGKKFSIGQALMNS